MATRGSHTDRVQPERSSFRARPRAKKVELGSVDGAQETLLVRPERVRRGRVGFRDEARRSDPVVQARHDTLACGLRVRRHPHGVEEVQRPVGAQGRRRPRGSGENDRSVRRQDEIENERGLFQGVGPVRHDDSVDPAVPQRLDPAREREHGFQIEVMARHVAELLQRDVGHGPERRHQVHHRIPCGIDRVDRGRGCIGTGGRDRSTGRQDADPGLAPGLLLAWALHGSTRHISRLHSKSKFTINNHPPRPQTNCPGTIVSVSHRTDVAVIGLGAMGAAVLYQLAALGIDAVGIDQYAPPHDLGSSHGETRITRCAVGEGEAYVPLALASHRIWRDLESRDRRPVARGLRLPDHGIDRELRPSRQDRFPGPLHRRARRLSAFRTRS